MTDYRNPSMRDDDTRTSRIIYAAAAAIIAVAGAVTYYFVSVSPEPQGTYPIPADVVGRLDNGDREIARRLGAEPCNRTLATKLANTLLNSSEYAAALSFVRKTEEACGPNEDLLPVVFFSQTGSSDFEGAEKTADFLLEKHPGSSRIYAWRAQARQGRGDLDGAYEDLSKAIYLVSDPNRVNPTGVEQLSKLAAEAGRPCEAVAVMRDFTVLDPSKWKMPVVREMMEKWRKDGDCPSPFGSGTASLKYDRSANIILMPAKVNGVTGRFIVDTGASRTVLTRSFAKKAKVTANDDEGATVITANGEVWQMGGRAEHITLGGAEARDVQIFVQQAQQAGFGEGIDGLLGLSFLGNFRVTLGGGSLDLEPSE